MEKYTSKFTGVQIDKLLSSVTGKAGYFHFDSANNRYLVFTSEEAKDEYFADPTKLELLLGTIVSGSGGGESQNRVVVNLTTPMYNTVPFGSKGNYINYTFDVINDSGMSTGESVVVTYKVTRGSNKVEFKETYRYGSKVSVNVDKYFGEGTNVITVNVMGVSSLISTTFSVTYDVINLSLTDQLDISKVYDLSKNEVAYIEIPYDVSGSYTKIMEWYIDGVQLDFNRSEDEILETTPVSRTKTIELSNLSQGKHSLQFRVGSRINGEMFYSDILYRDFFVYTGVNDHIMLGVALTIPSAHGVLGPSDALTIPNMMQYVSYDLRLASYSPINIAKTEVSVYLGEELVNVVTATNGVVSSVPLISNTDGEKTLRLVATEVELESEVTYSIPVTVAPTELSITEIAAALALDFTARGRSNNSLGRDEWHYGDIVGTLTGFKWNNTSGWVDNRLEFDEDSELHIVYAPLANHDNGKTIELEWSSKSVSDEETILCDLTNEEGTGILIKANSIVVMSAGKAELTQYYKSEENVRMGIVINPNRGANKGLTFIYTNGIVSRAINTIEGDNYISDKEIRFKGSVGAKVSLKAIRIYNAALTSEQMYNNFTLYRDTVAEMFEVYDRNDIYDGHLLDTTKMSSRLPVMIVTGDIPTLENTNDKDTQIVVDIEYINMQDTSRSFTMKNAAMRPQGTSSMGYPKKNFRIYTQKLEETELTVNGKVVEDRLYSFREGAIPVNCWCLKADYAESSGTHNTGIARLWGEAFKNARVTCNLGEGNPHNVSEATVLRTKAQQAAIDRKYPYDVRTTIDGFPILLFYRRSANDDVVFIGKYNFNNDKSTEAVFGFTDIPGFDNSRMQCWEVLNNGNAIGLFTDISDFYNNVTDKATGETKKGWEFAFEARYPDKSTNTTDLYAVTSWINGVKGNPTRFAQEKWDHLDVYKVAGYYCYLMRHAAADQFVKNAMFTSEDGEHFYYILYDNDTINGLINSGPIGILPTDNRESINADGSDKFAGRDSVLWNMLEADEEFMKIVRAVDNALYTAGISYGNAIKMFDETQADKWVERIYNLDAEYKYITPFTSSGVNNLFMLQGKRDLHRRWWLANRYSLYDSLFVSGAYKSGYVEIKCLNGTEPTQTFKVTSGYPIYYGFGINGILKQRSEAPLQPDEQVDFSITDTVNLGDPIALYGAPHLKEIDLSSMVQHISTISVAGVYNENLGTKLERLIIGSGINYNSTILEISGIKNARSLKYLDVSYLQALKGLDLSENFYLEELHASGTSIANITFAKGAPLSKMYLPRTFKTLHLTSLPALSFSGIYHELFPLVESIKIVDCPNLSNDFSWVYDWYYDKSVDNSRAVLEMDNIAWTNVDYRQLLELANIGTLKLKGKVTISEGSQEIIDEIKAVFGDTVFNKTSDFYVQAPDGVYLSGPTKLLEGESARFVCAVFSEENGRIQFSLPTSRQGCSIDATSGKLTTTETGLATSDIVVRAVFITDSGKVVDTTMTVTIEKRTYPTAIEIVGESLLDANSATYTLEATPTEITGLYTTNWAIGEEGKEYLRIESSNNSGCILKKVKDGVIETTLTATLVKNVDGSTVITKTKNISVVIEGVVITKSSNAPLQDCLYRNGLVAHEDYSEKWELALITANQLQPGSNAASSIFLPYLSTLSSFDEFKYFSGVLEILPSTFFGFTRLTSITIPNSVTSIGTYAFQKCIGLTAITIPNSVTSIGDCAFQYCNGLTAIDIPENSQLTSIGSNAFYNCSSITSISIPESVTSIGSSAFSGCSLTAVHISSIKAWCSIIFATSQSANPLYFANNLYLNGELVTELVIPEGVTSIGKWAFESYKKLISVTIPKSMTSIGKEAFQRCNNLKRVLNCSNLDIQKGTTTNGYVAYYAEKVFNLDEFIGDYAFKTIGDIHYLTGYKGNSTELTLPSEYKGNNYHIRAGAFDGNDTITSIVITKAVTNIEMPAIIDCNNLNTIVVESSNTIYDSRDNCNAVIETSTNTLVCGCKNSTIVNTVEVIGQSAFEGVTFDADKTDITLSSDINNIMPYAFRGTNIKTLVINTSNITIGTEAFSNCNNLTSVDLSQAVNEVQGALLFSNCKSLTTASVGFATDGMFNNCSELATVTLREGISQIKANAFSSCVKLSGINIPSSVTNIGNSAFYGCSGLTSITIPEGVTSIARNAFTGCSGLERVTINCTNVDSWFSNNTVIKEVILGTSVTSIGSKAFQGCSSLTAINIPENSQLTSIEKYAFDSCTRLTAITLPESVTSIGIYTFVNCSSLTSITIPESVTSIGNSAFRDCTSLASINIPEGVKSIENGTFVNCSSLTSITIPESVTSIGNSAFSGCKAVKTITMIKSSAPGVGNFPFGSDEVSYTGRNTYNTGENTLYVPQGATGYDTGQWLDPLQNAEKCGFTISYTL